ncbi:MAG: site-2 protease family protein [Bacteroidetes bacterium]|nr:site-2 protease family protein [Bacteroidota bacterium]
MNIDAFQLENFSYGLPYAVSLLFILTAHEFGHYFAARYHGVAATLPYYIPFPPVPSFLNFGTFGAVIRTKSPIPNKKVMFDIGVAGPIAGFAATLIVLIYGFTHLPGKEFILHIHPEYFSPYKETGLALGFGEPLLYKILSFTLTNPMNEFVPPMSEMYHYPYLLAGWFGLFVTAMNLIPIGQLDGGHLSYTMFGEKHKLLSRFVFTLLIAMGIAGGLENFNINLGFGWFGWLFWALALYFIVKLDHPPVEEESELSEGRKAVGWMTFIIFLLSFVPTPFSFSL